MNTAGKGMRGRERGMDGRVVKGRMRERRDSENGKQGEGVTRRSKSKRRGCVIALTCHSVRLTQHPMCCCVSCVSACYGKTRG